MSRAIAPQIQQCSFPTRAGEERAEQTATSHPAPFCSSLRSGAIARKLILEPRGIYWRLARDRFHLPCRSSSRFLRSGGAAASQPRSSRYRGREQSTGSRQTKTRLKHDAPVFPTGEPAPNPCWQSARRTPPVPVRSREHTAVRGSVTKIDSHR